MAESVDGAAKELAHAGTQVFDDVFEVFAEYIAPIVGVIIGWALAGKVGGVQMLGGVVNYFINPKNNPATWPTATLIGGIGMAAIWGSLAVALWGAGKAPAVGATVKKTTTLVVTAVKRLFSGVFVGMAASALIQGINDSPADGWLEELGGKAEAVVSEVP